MVISPNARTRSRSRSNERGAAMFVVLMVVMILSAIGTFALANARYEVQAAGFTRYRAVSQDIGQFGAAAAMAEVGGGSRTKLYLTRMSSSTEICTANAGVTGPTECYTLSPTDIELQTGLTTEKLFRPKVDSTSTPGSLGLNELGGYFSIELTERLELSRSLPGWQNAGKAGDPVFYDLTVSSLGAVFLDTNANGKIDYSTGEGASAVFTKGRGHVIVGPISP